MKKDLLRKRNGVWEVVTPRISNRGSIEVSMYPMSTSIEFVTRLNCKLAMSGRDAFERIRVKYKKAFKALATTGCLHPPSPELLKLEASGNWPGQASGNFPDFVSRGKASREVYDRMYPDGPPEKTYDNDAPGG